MAYIPVRRRRRPAARPSPWPVLAALALLALLAPRFLGSPDLGFIARGTRAPVPPTAVVAPTNTPLAIAVPTAAPAPAAAPQPTAAAPRPIAAQPSGGGAFPTAGPPARGAGGAGAVGGDVLTSLPIGQPEAMAALVGRRAHLTGVTVQEIVGDKTFWVGPSEDQQVFVFLEETTDPQGVEGGVDVEAGQTLALMGTVESVPESPQQEFEVDPNNAAQLSDEQVYIRAEQAQPQG